MDACEVRLSNRLSYLIEFRSYSGNFREKNFFCGHAWPHCSRLFMLAHMEICYPFQSFNHSSFCDTLTSAIDLWLVLEPRESAAHATIFVTAFKGFLSWVSQCGLCFCKVSRWLSLCLLESKSVEWVRFLSLIKPMLYWAHCDQRQQNGELCQLELNGHLFFETEGICTTKVF